MELFRKAALPSEELKRFEEQHIIDDARIKNSKSPTYKNKIRSVKESTENLTKEIQNYTAEMNDYEFKEYCQSKDNFKKDTKEAVEFSLLRNSIMAALSSDDDDEKIDEGEDNSLNEVSEVNINMEDDNNKFDNYNSPISKKVRIKNGNNLSTSNFYRNFNSQLSIDSHSMKYEDLMSYYESSLKSPEVAKNIDAADKVRMKLYSPFMSKRSIQPSLPQNLSISNLYRTPQNSKIRQNSFINNNNSIVSNRSNFSSTNRTPNKNISNINGVNDHIQRLRRARQITPRKKDDSESFREVITPNRPILTPNKAELTNLFEKEIDQLLQENYHLVIQQYDM